MKQKKEITMNNIERFRLLKELQARKAALHKEQLLEHFSWDTSETENKNTLEKVLSYGQTGLSLYRFFSKLTTKNTN